MPTTRRAADVAAEIADEIRALNYATSPVEGYPGLTWVADVYDLVGALAAGSARLQQSLGHAAAFLVQAIDRGGLVNAGTFPESPDPDTAITNACAGLYEAERLTGELAQLLDRSAQAIAWVAHASGPQDHGNR